MAARTLRPRHQDEVRTKIQASQLLNRLQNHALGKPDEKPVELSTTQIKAIEILLRKTLPDLSSVELTGDPNRPVEMNMTVELVSARSDT